MGLPQTRPLLIDLETRSACDLRKAGGYNYAVHPTTRLLTAAWVDGETYHVWLPGCDSVPTQDTDVTYHFGTAVNPLADYTDRLWVAHNAWTFDRPVWSALFPTVTPRRWYDTYPLALAAGLPGQLDQIGKRLWGEGKRTEGSSALKKWTRAVSYEDADPRNVPPGLVALIASYNVQDVRLLSYLWDELSVTLSLPSTERMVQQAHDVINDRGCLVDVGLIRALRDLSQESVKEAVEEIAVLTGGALPDLAALRQRTRVQQWMLKYGVVIQDPSKKGLVPQVGEQPKETLRRDAVQQWIASVEGGDADDADGDEGDPDAGAVTYDTTKVATVARVLSLRNAAMRITEGKLETALARVGTDGRIRGLFAYHSAHTGRWAGRGVQVQNLPRPKKGVDVWALTRRYEATGALRLADVKPLLTDGATTDDAASALIRGIFIPNPGDECLLAADLASIESRVLAWLAGEETLLAAFRDMSCPYSLMAKKVYGREVTGKKDPIRQVGKVIVLGCGYGLGADKFTLFGASSGIDFAKAGVTPYECVDAFRTAFPAIAGTVMGEFEGRRWRRGGFWEDLQATSLAAVRAPGREMTVGRLSFEVRNGHLYVTLPSGRAICYRSAREVTTHTWWGKEVQTVEYQSPRFRATTMYGGKWAENVVQAVSRDFLAAALVRLQTTTVLHVHDEVVASGRREDLPAFMKAFTAPLSWSSGLPLDAEGGIMPRYAKTPPEDWPREELWRDGKRVS